MGENIIMKEFGGSEQNKKILRKGKSSGNKELSR